MYGIIILLYIGYNIRKMMRELLSKNTVQLKRECHHQSRPSLLDTTLPNHTFEDEVIPEYQSFLVETNISGGMSENTQHQDQTSQQGEEPSTPTTKKDWLATAKQHKDKGNAIFRVSDKYAQVEKEYHRALHCLRRSPRTKEAEDLRVQVYVNLTACDLGKNDYASARAHATKALKHDPNNVKSLFRRAQARRFAACDLDGAEADLVAALKISPNEQAIAKLLDQIRKDRIRSEQAESELAKRMFS